MATAKLFVSSQDQAYELTRMPDSAFQKAGARPDDNTVVVDPTVAYQPIFGFGANWTDTDVYNLLRMSPAQQDAALEALFDREKGAGWNFMRVPFGSTDWERNTSFYSYDDMPEGEKDWELKHFSIQKDIDRGFFELLRRVQRKYPDMRLLASVWGLPGWMKDNDSLISGIFNPECAEVYARYLRMAVQAWHGQGVELYALTTQNEPKSSNNRGTPATRFTWRMQKDVLIALRREFTEHGIGTKIWCYDHNFDMANIFVDPMLADAEARAAIDGVAFHPYRGDPAVMGRIWREDPDMPMYSTERTIYTVSEMGEMLDQLRNGARSYIHWVFFSDEYGGPHQNQGQPFLYQDPPPVELRPTLTNCYHDADRWTKNPSWGMFAQFSRFLRRGMTQVDCTYGHKKWVTAVAFRHEGGEIAVVAVNETGTGQSFSLRCGDSVLPVALPGRSVGTVLFTPDEAMRAGCVKVADAPVKTVPEPPVWRLDPVDLFFDGAAEAGREIRWKVRVRNTGSAAVPPRATVFIDILLDGDFRIARIYADCPALKPGEEAEFSAFTPILSEFGTKSTWTAERGWHDVMALMSVGNVFPVKDSLFNRICKEFCFK